MMIRRAFFALVLGLFIAGCRSDIYYQNQAVGRARKFLLENSGDLSTDEINFVRYNAPVLLHAPVLGNPGAGSKERLSSELRQVCVTWIIPGRDKLYMVFGVSAPRMDGWRPVRMLVRDYSKYTPVLAAPAGLAREYARNNFYSDMSDYDVNLVRYTFPYLMRTNFELNFDPHGTLSAEDLEKLRLEADRKIQYSLVWKLANGKALVFVGLADSGMVNWTIHMAEMIDESQLNENVTAVVMTPDQGLEVLPASETAADGEEN